MKRTQKVRWFLSGMLAAALTAGLLTPALAALAEKTIQVYTGVNVYVDDQLLQPQDANGNPVEVFVYNGTTYLPIRAVGEALGLPVLWEGQTQSAYVGKHSGDKPNMWVKDLDYFTGSEWRVEDWKDNLGVEHQNVIYGIDMENTYLINGQYSAISGTFFQKYEKRSSSGISTLKIYGDDELLYSAEMKGGIKPLDFYVNLTGVLELKIIFNGYSSQSGWSAAIAGFGLWT